MALPQDGQDANGLTKVTQIPAGKELMFIDPTTNEGGIITLEDLTKQILNGLTSQTFGLDSGTQTLPAAINYLYGKSQTLDFIECRVKTVSGTVKITKETIISGTAPSLSSYIPIIIGHKSTNNVVDYVFYDSPNWIVKSDAEQEITIRFYKTAK
ncbi:hypothetical protein LI294_20685 [bacterium 210702-DFI.5.13]|nr:hypothetical protein [bacterium 210702-DFI.5.13]